MRRCLLIEPGYKTKYPPLGLMKLSTYHKLRGDRIVFARGRRPDLRCERWDRIYVASPFTFFWSEIIRTIRYYVPSTASPKHIYAGGIMATLLGDELERDLGITVIRGLLDKPYMLDADCPFVVDQLIPDYGLLRQSPYEYSREDAYVVHATRGCPRRCAFCAVSLIEPEFVHFQSIKRQVRGIEAVYGTRQDLLFLDNNVLASREFERIIGEVLDLGFEKGATREGRARRMDFNQGLDAEMLDSRKMAMLARTALHPLRMALDDSAGRDGYIKAVRLARDCGLLKQSTYVLYNYRDTPEDFYERLRISVCLNEEIGTQVSSFPMKYVPLDAKDRTFIGPHWSRKLIRGVQCILLATRGMVSPSREFFEAAFGSTAQEFVKIALMPERYIVYRARYATDGADDWTRAYENLDASERDSFRGIVSGGAVTERDVTRQSSGRLKRLLRHYVVGETVAQPGGHL